MREVGVGKRNEVKKGGQHTARFKDRVKGEEMMGEAGRSGEGMESRWSISRRSGRKEVGGKVKREAGCEGRRREK